MREGSRRVLLARIPREETAAGPDTCALNLLRSLGLLEVRFRYACGGFGRKPRWYGRLRTLATRTHAISGLALAGSFPPQAGDAGWTSQAAILPPGDAPPVHWNPERIRSWPFSPGSGEIIGRLSSRPVLGDLAARQHLLYLMLQVDELIPAAERSEEHT